MKRINIISLGGISRIALEILSDRVSNRNIYIYDDNPAIQGAVFNNVKVVGKLNDLINLPKGDYYFNGIGNYDLYKMRISLSKDLVNKGAIGYTVQHVSSIISDSALIGSGSFISVNVNVGYKSTIGSDCVLFSNSTIEHESHLGKLTYISPGVIICGKVRIGNYCYIGPGAIISAGITIGDKCIIGAGSVVLNDIPDSTFAYGNPARIINKNNLW